ncbi:MAG: hypothetical protein C0521_01190 [Xanthomonas sp.]|nr:hypothetical protein [Xanthomonas sp.]
MPRTQIEKCRVIHSAKTFRRCIGPRGLHADGAVLPQDGSNGTQPQLRYHLDDFQNAIDLLRNEKPVYLLYNGSGSGFGNALVTDPETVGEDETSGPRFAGR